MKKNQVIYFPKVREAAVIEQKIPRPGAGEVLIKTICSLISTGTEMTAYCGEFAPGTTWEEHFSCPYYPGYNNVGVIVELGEGVDASWLGKRVVTNGHHAAYITVLLNPLSGDQAKGKSVCIEVPDDISDEDAVFFSIPQIVMNGIRTSKVQWGECAVVFGLGLLGQFAVRFLRESGAFPVIAADISDHRLNLLPRDLAIVPVNSLKNDVASIVAQCNSGRKADLVIELTSNADLLPKQISLLREKGRLVILSSPKNPVLFDFEDNCAWPSIAIIGCHNFSHPDYPQLDNPWTVPRHIEMFFDLLKFGMLDLKPLVSRNIDFREAPAAYRALEHDRSREMGIILDWRNVE